MRVVQEAEFRQAIKRAVLGPTWTLRIRSVTGPGRSGAVASVYASHLLGVPWIPATIPAVPDRLRPVLVIDTASKTGAAIRKLARRMATPYWLAVFNEPPNVRFWYEVQA